MGIWVYNECMMEIQRAEREYLYQQRALIMALRLMADMLEEELSV